MTVMAHIDAIAYERAFEQERKHEYPAITAFENMIGFRVDRAELERAARVLACPVKAHPPNWQHGRVLYAVACIVLSGRKQADVLLDIGTAKGFSALMLQWALLRMDIPGRVVSMDVINPSERIQRNTVAEVDGLKTLPEILQPWPEARDVEFVHADSRLWLTRYTDRVSVAFIDGKHTYEAVSWDASLLAVRQQAGDAIVFDDLQIPGIKRAVDALTGYDIQRIWAHKSRGYAVAWKR